MLRSEAIAIIKRGLGFRQTQDQAIVAALLEAQRDLELGKTLPNFLLEFDAPITVVADNANISLPVGFIRMSDDYDMYYNNEFGAPVTLPRQTYTDAQRAYVASGEPNTVPLEWSDNYPAVVVIRNKTTALLVPTPKVDFTAYLTYYKADQKLDSDIENKWLANAPDALIGRAGMTVAYNLRDKDALTRFTQQAKMGSAALLGDIIEDELAGRALIMGRNN